MVEKVFAIAKEIKVGKYVLMDNIPYKVVQIESSKPGKHGAAKMRITGVSIFGGQKKVLLTPGDADVEVPIIERKVVQVLSVSGNTAQVMEKESYEVYDMDVPAELQGQVEAGKEVDILGAMGKRMMERVR